uniref:G-protein coupled receptors family 1 profile domain-containing protein n=1 Tax=Plectus sambesii TaxID=2011161 RepID=A0A914V8J2_9BILA
MTLSPIYFLIVLTGFLQFSTNLVIAIIILRFKGLRREKEYVIFLGQAIADGIDGIPSMYAGIYRIFLTLYGNPLAPATPFYCMIVGLHNSIWAWSDTAQSLMMLVVSVDRLLAVAIPLRYHALTSTYAKRTVAAVFLYCLASASSAWIYPITELAKSNDSANYSITHAYPTGLCSTTATVGVIFNEYYTNIRVCAVIGSVVLYILVIILFAKHMRKFDSPIRHDINHKRQLRLTITLGFQCAFHIIFYIIPLMLVSTMSLGFNIISSTTQSYLLIFTNANAIINLFIYLKRQKEFRFAFKTALANQKLAPIMSLWPVQAMGTPKIVINNRVGNTSFSVPIKA